MAFPYAGDATMRARVAGKLKRIAVPTHLLTPAQTGRNVLSPHACFATETVRAKVFCLELAFCAAVTHPQVRPSVIEGRCHGLRAALGPRATPDSRPARRRRGPG